MPIRQKVHFPHDSFCVKSRKKRAISTMQVWSSMTTMPPEPMMAPVAGIDSKSTGVCPSEAGMQPPDGPPICTALNLRPSLMPPPILKTRSLMGMPIGTSASPPSADLAREREDLRAAALLGAVRRVGCGAVREDPRDVGVGLDVVVVRRLLPEALLGGEGRPDARHAALALDRLRRAPFPRRRRTRRRPA